MPDKDLWERAEVMEYLRISRGTLDKLQKRREIPFAKIGKKVLFRKADIDRWLEDRMVPALCPPPRARRPSGRSVPAQDKKEKSRGRRKGSEPKAK